MASRRGLTVEGDVLNELAARGIDGRELIQIAVQKALREGPPEVDGARRVGQVIGGIGELVGRAVGSFLVIPAPLDAGVVRRRDPFTGETTFRIGERFGRRDVDDITPERPAKPGYVYLKLPFVEEHMPGFNVKTLQPIEGQSSLRPEVKGLGPNLEIVLGGMGKFVNPLVAANNGFTAEQAKDAVRTSVLNAVVAATVSSEVFRGEVQRVIDETPKKGEQIETISAITQEAIRQGVLGVAPEITGMEFDESVTGVDVRVPPTMAKIIEAQTQAQQIQIEGGAKADVWGQQAGAIAKGIVDALLPVLPSLPSIISAAKDKES